MVTLTHKSNDGEWHTSNSDICWPAERRAEGWIIIPYDYYFFFRCNHTTIIITKPTNETKREENDGSFHGCWSQPSVPHWGMDRWGCICTHKRWLLAQAPALCLNYLEIILREAQRVYVCVCVKRRNITVKTDKKRSSLERFGLGQITPGARHRARARGDHYGGHPVAIPRGILPSEFPGRIVSALVKKKKKKQTSVSIRAAGAERKLNALCCFIGSKMTPPRPSLGTVINQIRLINDKRWESTGKL